MINKVLLFGIVCENVSEKATSTGKRMITFSLRQESNYKDKSTGEDKKFTSYFNIAMFNEDIQVCPGDNVLLEGKLGNSKDKNDKYILGITAQKITVISEANSEKKAHKVSEFDGSIMF